MFKHFLKTSKMKIKSILYFLLVIIVCSCTENKYQIWIASPWQMVLQNSPPGELKEIRLKAAANEYEPFRIIIHAGTHPLKDVNVIISNLKNNKEEISYDNFQLYRAHYLNITEPSYRTQNQAGWYPDALIPFSDPRFDDNIDNIIYRAVPFDIDTAKNAEVWCDLFVPSGTKPGNYRGKVIVFSGTKKLAKLPVELEVWNFELPDKISMRSRFGSFSEDLRRFHKIMLGVDENSPEFVEMEDVFIQELLKHRAVARTLGNIWPDWNAKDGIIEKGEAERLKWLVEENHVNSLYFPFIQAGKPNTSKDYIKATSEWLKKLGYFDIAYIKLEDEPNNAEEYEIVRQQGAMIKEAVPDLKRLCTEQTLTSNPDWGDLYGAVDIWCPLWGLWDEKTAEERLSLGEELWSYTALNQGPKGTPWWQIDMDPLNYRAPMWLSWKYNITGFAYWSSVYWGPYKTPRGVWEAPHFRDRFWGEGVLLYPGLPAGIKGFVPSIRLKLYREAAEDFEYMVLAAKTHGKNEVNKIVNNLVTNFQEWSQKSEEYYNARESLARLITLKN